MSEIHAILMPKWGLSMEEGTIVAWHKAEGDTVEVGDELADIETTKLTSTLEAQNAGTLRRRVAAVDETLPCGCLIAVVAPSDVDDSEIAAFVDAHVDAAVEAGEADEETKAPAPETLEIDGRPVRYLAMGKGGIPAVFIHGFGGDLETWMLSQPVLAEARATYAIDLPGHGGSDKTVADGDPAALAAHVRAVLDALELNRVHLIGHSMGGAVAALIALDSPGRVASLSLIAPAGLGPEIDVDFLDAFIAAGRRKELKPLLQQLVGDPAAVTRDMVDAVVRYKRIDGVSQALTTVRDGLVRDGGQAVTIRERLGEINVPLLVVWGEADRIIPARHVEGLGDEVAARVLTLPGVGHMPHMEAAGEVSAALAELFAEG